MCAAIKLWQPRDTLTDPALGFLFSGRHKADTTLKIAVYRKSAQAPWVSSVVTGMAVSYTHLQHTSAVPETGRTYLSPTIFFHDYWILGGLQDSQTAKFKYKYSKCSCTEMILMLQLSLSRCTHCMDNRCLQVIRVLTRFPAAATLPPWTSCLWYRMSSH